MSETAAPAENPHAPATVKKSGKGRGVVAWILVVVASIMLPIAVVAFWGQRTITDAEVYLETVLPLAEEEAIKEAIVNRTTTTLMATIEESGAIDEALQYLPPEAAAKIGPPIKGAFTSLVEQVVTKLVNSEQFTEFWRVINTAAQKALITALSGETDGAVSITNGALTLDTSVVAEKAKQELVDRGVTALANTPIPPQLDQNIVLLQSDELAEAQLIYKFTIPMARFMLPLTALVMLAAIAISARRARVVAGIGIGMFLGMGILGIGLAFAQQALLAAAPSTAVQSLFNAFWTTLTRFLTASVGTWVTGGVILALLGWLGGRSAPATKLRGLISGSLIGGGAKVNSPGLNGLSSFVDKWWQVIFVVIAALGTVGMFASALITQSMVIWTTIVCIAACVLVTFVRGIHRTPAPAPAAATGSGIDDATSITQVG